MTSRKSIVETYFEGFRTSNEPMVLGCLTEDVVWEIHGYKCLTGKEEFASEIVSPAFVGNPTLDVEHLVEEGNTVVAAGTGLGALAAGGDFRFKFATVLVFRDNLVCRVESFVVPL